jgi:hypothetical protein
VLSAGRRVRVVADALAGVLRVLPRLTLGGLQPAARGLGGPAQVLGLLGRHLPAVGKHIGAGLAAAAIATAAQHQDGEHDEHSHAERAGANVAHQALAVLRLPRYALPFLALAAEGFLLLLAARHRP